MSGIAYAKLTATINNYMWNMWNNYMPQMCEMTLFKLKKTSNELAHHCRQFQKCP